MAKKYSMTIEEDLTNVALKQRKTWGPRPTNTSELYEKNIIVFLPENFDEDILTPFGHLDGETGHRERKFVIAGDCPVNLFGEVISDIEFCRGDFSPDFNEDQDWGSEDDEKHDDGVDFHRAPIWAGGRMSFYLNPHRKMKVRGRIVNRFY